MFNKGVISSIVLGIICLSGIMIYADSVDVPVDVQSNMLLRTLGYDRAILKKDGDEVRIGILYNENNTESMKAFEIAGDWLYEQKSAGRKIGNKNLKFTGMSYYNEAGLKSMIENLDVSVLYVTPGNEENLIAISNVANSKEILTFGGRRDYVAHGLAIGVEMEAGKPRVIINLANAKTQGADFKAEFLKVAKVVN